jgi:hypothetical protein
MNEERITESLSCIDPRGQVMKTPDDVVEMLRLRVMYGRRPRCKRNLTICEAFGCGHVFGL